MSDSDGPEPLTRRQRKKRLREGDERLKGAQIVGCFAGCVIWRHVRVQDQSSGRVSRSMCAVLYASNIKEAHQAHRLNPIGPFGLY
eukprot:2669146-Pyramimonas_sp.AAC.1